MIEVQGPDGQRYQFPDGTSPDTMRDAMRRRYGGPATPRPADPTRRRQPPAPAAAPVQAATSPPRQPVPIIAPSGADAQTLPVPIDQRARNGRGTFLDPLVGQGLMMGWGDEARAAVRAGVGSVMGEGSYGDLYSQELQSGRANQEAYAERHPVLSPVLTASGAVATVPFTPGLAAARGAGMAGRMGAGAATGAGYGAVAGSGMAEGGAGETLAGGAAGGLAGAFLGGAAVPAIEGVIGAGRGIAAAARPLMGRIRQTAEANRRVGNALVRDTGSLDAARRQVATLPRLQQMGVPAVVGDIGGETTRGLARSSANTSPEAREAIDRVVQPRFGLQSERVTGVVRRMAGTQANSVARQQQLQATAQGLNQRNYNAAYQAGDRPIWSQRLEQLSSSPAMQSAFKAAIPRVQDRAAAEGFGGMNAPFRIDPSGLVTFNKGPSGQPVFPNLRHWDIVQRELRDQVSKARNTGANEEAGAIEGVRKAVNEELDAAVPAFRTARAGAAEAFGAEEALEAGQNFVTMDLNNADAMRAFQKLNPAEQALFREGFASELINKVGAVRDRTSVINSAFLRSPNARQRIEMVFGKGGADTMELFLRSEDMLDMLRQAMGNSTTARQLAEMGLAGGSGLYGTVTGDWKNAGIGFALAGGSLLAKTRIDPNIARKVGEMLSSPDPQAVFDALNRIGRNEKLRNAIRAGHEYLSRAMTPLAGSAGAGITARPATPEDIERLRQMQQQQGPAP